MVLTGGGRGRSQPVTRVQSEPSALVWPRTDGLATTHANRSDEARRAQESVPRDWMLFPGNQDLTCRNRYPAWHQVLFCDTLPDRDQALRTSRDHSRVLSPWHDVPLPLVVLSLHGSCCQKRLRRCQSPGGGPDEKPAPVVEQTTSLLSSCLNSCVQGPMLLAIVGL